MIAKAQSAGNLSFLNGIDDSWSSDVIWMAIDTPVSETDEPILGPLVEIVQLVKSKKSQPQVFATSSQIPLGFSEELEAALGKKIAYIPENLRLGQGIATFRNADRTVIGASLPDVAQRVQNLMTGFETRFMNCDLPTAEMVKHANNAFLATSISFANEMASIGSRFGVDNYFVAQALKLDSRIGSKAYVAPGLGFAGGTLPRDLRVIEGLGRKNGMKTPLVSAVLEINRTTSEKVAELAFNCLGADADRRVLILGYTYKADTDTLRRSMSVEIAQSLKARGIRCQGFDPFMNGKDLSGLDGIEHHEKIEDVPPCPVALVMTARPAFKELAWDRLAKPANGTIVIDTQGFLEAGALKAAGLEHMRLWAPRHKEPTR